MKTLPLKNWELSEDLDCLLFFSQRASEVLFDYTLDSYKYPALYASSIIEETTDIIEKIQNNESPVKSLEPIIEELKWKLRKDRIVHSIVGDLLDDYLKLDVSNLQDLKVKLELLYNKIRPSIYIKKCFDIIEKLVKENRQKRVLNKIIPNFYSALIDYGYCQGFIHVQTLRFFFYRQEDEAKIKDTSVLKDYFEIFTLKPEEYSVVFKGSSIFSELKDSCSAFDIEVKEAIEATTENKGENYFINKKRNDELFIVCNDIRALDPQSAKNNAESMINNISKLFTYFHHKKQPRHSKQAIIYLSEPNQFVGKISTQTSPMHKCFDLYPSKAASKLNSLLKDFGLESKSFFKFDKAVELHAISLSSQHSENQLLQNWIAFETLLVGYSQESKIKQVLDTLVPALKLNYLSRIIATLTEDLIRWNKVKSEDFLSEIENCNNILEKVGALVSIEENKPIREKFYNALSDFPLLKFRLLQIKSLFETTSNIYEYYCFHDQKLIWQIKRIYRTRNLIVHTGYVPDFTDVLIENSHTYLDLLLNQMIDLVVEGRQISNIGHGIKEIQILQKKHEKYLKSELNNQITNDNFKKLIFGYSTFANTWYS